jgi:hypothetical protein
MIQLEKIDVGPITVSLFRFFRDGDITSTYQVSVRAAGKELGHYEYNNIQEARLGLDTTVDILKSVETLHAWRAAQKD